MICLRKMASMNQILKYRDEKGKSIFKEHSKLKQLEIKYVEQYIEGLVKYRDKNAKFVGKGKTQKSIDKIDAWKEGINQKIVYARAVLFEREKLAKEKKDKKEKKEKEKRVKACNDERLKEYEQKKASLDKKKKISEKNLENELANNQTVCTNSESKACKTSNKRFERIKQVRKSIQDKLKTLDADNQDKTKACGRSFQPNLKF